MSDRYPRWGKPSGSDNFHIFQDDGLSVCGNWRMSKSEMNGPVEDHQTWRRGKDCKLCCQMMELLSEDDDYLKGDEIHGPIW